MRYVLLIVFFLIISILIIRKKDKKMLIVCLAICAVAVFSFVTSIRTIPGLLTLSGTSNQIFYQKDNLENGTYPDAILPLLVKGKTIYVKDDKYDIQPDWLKNENNGWNWEVHLHEIYHGINAPNLLSSYDANVVLDDSMNNYFVSDSQKILFENLGSSNDMFRNSFAVNDYTEEWSNYFHYYWFYTVFGEDMNIYICPDGLKEDTIVALWDDLGSESGDSLYLMSYDYYKDEVAK